ncbi:glycine-rich domain-containing protein [Streptomyces sp. bgisy034]|uniref:glycine-rich domain-containing protein n=1 Tax=Streptomyces sp. bgisy034 TaxID=3413774 RepID=UPI003EB7A11C
MTVDTSVVEAPVGHELANKHLIDTQLWDRLVNRIVKDESMERSLAERIMDQALAFLTLCAREPQGHYSPSPLVDIGWHTFILYTRAYQAFGERMGKFIHHEPSDVPGIDYGTGNIARTVAALKAQGIAVDEPLWVNTNHLCSGECSGDSGGGDSGGGANCEAAAKMKVADCSSYCSGDSCAGGGGDGDSGCSH